MDRPDDLIDLAEAARLLGVTRMTLSRWLRRGRLPAFQYGERGIYRLRRGDVLAFVEANRLAAREHRTADAAGTGPEHGAG